MGGEQNRSDNTCTRDVSKRRENWQYLYATLPPPPHSLFCFHHDGRRWMSKEARTAELREKFETAVPSIQEKLKVEAERRQQQRNDNEELRGKLVSFAEQAKLRCAIVMLRGLRAL